METPHRISDIASRIVIRIRTATQTGSGFYVASHQCLVTNYHLVKGFQEVVVEGKHLSRIRVPVLFTDTRCDLAFLQAPEGFTPASPPLATVLPQSGQQVWAVGHPLGLDYTLSRGIIAHSRREYDGVGFLQVDVSIHPGNSGGPLLDDQGHIVGVNTMALQQGSRAGLSLPNSYLIENLDLYKAYHPRRVLRCPVCRSMQPREHMPGGYCTQCGHHFPDHEFAPQEFLTVGMVAGTEGLISALGHDASLARTSPFLWEIEQQGVKVQLLYAQKTRLLVVDAMVCQLPEKEIAGFYEFLLQQNHILKNLTLSVRKQGVLMSWMCFEDDFQHESAVKTVKEMIGKIPPLRQVLSQNFEVKNMDGQ